MPVTIQITVHTDVDGSILVVPDNIKKDSEDISTDADTTTSPRMRSGRFLRRDQNGARAGAPSWFSKAVIGWSPMLAAVLIKCRWRSISITGGRA
jgi:hypothetical protein